MKKIFIAFLSLLLQLLISGSTIAAGLGISFNYGAGQADLDCSSCSDEALDLFGSDLDRWGHSLLFDTTVTGNRLFNYRLGLEKNKARYGRLEFNEANIVQDFGFGIIRTPSHRVWVGPELQLSIHNAHSDEFEGSSAGVGIGLAAGVNWTIGKVLTGVLKGGVVRTAYYTTFLDVLHLWVSGNRYSVHETEAYLGVGVVWRFKEPF